MKISEHFWRNAIQTIFGRPDEMSQELAIGMRHVLSPTTRAWVSSGSLPRACALGYILSACYAGWLPSWRVHDSSLQMPRRLDLFRLGCLLFIRVLRRGVLQLDRVTALVAPGVQRRGRRIRHG